MRYFVIAGALLLGDVIKDETDVVEVRKDKGIDKEEFDG